MYKVGARSFCVDVMWLKVTGLELLLPYSLLVRK